MPRHKAYNEEFVAEKAMQLFWANGYRNTSARMLEKGMGINRFSIYSSFEDKEGVLLASVIQYKSLIKKELLDPLTEGPKIIQQIQTFFYNFLHFTKEKNRFKGCLLINTANELADDIPEKVAVEIVRFSEEILNAFKHIIAAEKGKPTDLVAKEANYLFVALQGLMLTSKTVSQEQMDNYIEMTFRQV